MQDRDITPGLSAWRARQKRARQRSVNRAILLTGLSGAALYALPLHMNPLVRAGILVAPPAQQAVAIPQVKLAITVQPSDLPKHRPTLNDARAVDRIEAAHVVGVVPSPKIFASPAPPSPAQPSNDSEPPSSLNPSDLNHTGSGEPMLATITAWGEQLPTAAMPPARKPAPVPAKALPTKTEPDEDMATLRKRLFTPDR